MFHQLFRQRIFIPPTYTGHPHHLAISFQHPLFPTIGISRLKPVVSFVESSLQIFHGNTSDFRSASSLSHCRQLLEMSFRISGYIHQVLILIWGKSPEIGGILVSSPTGRSLQNIIEKYVMQCRISARGKLRFRIIPTSRNISHLRKRQRKIFSRVYTKLNPGRVPCQAGRFENLQRHVRVIFARFDYLFLGEIRILLFRNGCRTVCHDLHPERTIIILHGTGNPHLHRDIRLLRLYRTERNVRVILSSPHALVPVSRPVLHIKIDPV